MKFVAGGVRGTAPTANRSFSAFGGDTTSYLIQSNSGDQVVVDLGSGVSNLFPYFLNEAGNKKLAVFVTHFHLDHLIGLVVLPNLNGAKTEIRIAARVHGEFEIEEVVNNLIKPPYWPLGIRAMSNAVEFENLPDRHGEAPRMVGDIAVRWCPQQHPGGSTVYRFDEGSTGKSVVVATDVEWQASTEEQKHDFIALCTECGPLDLLVMDGQFQESEYPKFTGWGHSTWTDVLQVAKASGAKQVLITHHSPINCDTRLIELEQALKAEDIAVRLARQDECIEL